MSQPGAMICPMDKEHDDFFNHEGKEAHMSIEARLEALTAAVVALTAAISAKGGAVAAPAPQKPADKPTSAPTPTPTPASSGTSAALDYEKDLKPLALRLAKEKGRETLIKLNEEFKVAHANLLKPEQYGAFIKRCNEALTAPASA